MKNHFKTYRRRKSNWPPNALLAAQSKVGKRSFQDLARWHHRPTYQSRLGRHSRVYQLSSRDSSGPPAAKPSGRHQTWCSDQHASVRTTPSPWRWLHRVDSERETSPCCNIRSVASLKHQPNNLVLFVSYRIITNSLVLGQVQHVVSQYRTLVWRKLVASAYSPTDHRTWTWRIRRSNTLALHRL